MFIDSVSRRRIDRRVLACLVTSGWLESLIEVICNLIGRDFLFMFAETRQAPKAPRRGEHGFKKVETIRIANNRDSDSTRPNHQHMLEPTSNRVRDINIIAPFETVS